MMRSFEQKLSDLMSQTKQDMDRFYRNSAEAPSLESKAYWSGKHQEAIVRFSALYEIKLTAMLDTQQAQLERLRQL